MKYDTKLVVCVIPQVIRWSAAGTYDHWGYERALCEAAERELGVPCGKEEKNEPREL